MDSEKPGLPGFFFMSSDYMNRIHLKILRSRLLLILTSLLVIYGLFLMPATEQGPRYLSAGTNLGHIGAFFLIWSFLFYQSARLQAVRILQLLVLVLTISFLVAGLIELLQGLVGRDSEWQDVWDSMVGAMLATAITAPQLREWSGMLRHSWQVLSLILLLVVPWSIWRVLIDEAVIWYQHPVLCNFETPFELGRWDRNQAKLTLQNDRSGRRFLDVEFQPAQYSTVTLRYFYSDWHAYRLLTLDVTNPEQQAFRVVLRVHDILHKRHHYDFNDRFNKSLILKPGHQEIKIPMSDIKSAPHTRSMDMRHIEAMSLFTMRSNVYHHLYINSVYLE